jgi:hypothetical protein
MSNAIIYPISKPPKHSNPELLLGYSTGRDLTLDLFVEKLAVLKPSP